MDKNYDLFAGLINPPQTAPKSRCITPARRRGCNQHSRWGAGSKLQIGLGLPDPELVSPSAGPELRNSGYESFDEHFEAETYAALSIPMLERLWFGTKAQQLSPRFHESASYGRAMDRRIAKSMLYNAVDALNADVPGCRKEVAEDATIELNWLNGEVSVLTIERTCAVLSLNPIAVRSYVAQRCTGYISVGPLSILRKRAATLPATRAAVSCTIATTAHDSGMFEMPAGRQVGAE